MAAWRCSAPASAARASSSVSRPTRLLRGRIAHRGRGVQRFLRLGGRLAHHCDGVVRIPRALAPGGRGQVLHVRVAPHGLVQFLDLPVQVLLPRREPARFVSHGVARRGLRGARRAFHVGPLPAEARHHFTEFRRGLVELCARCGKSRLRLALGLLHSIGKLVEFGARIGRALRAGLPVGHLAVELACQRVARCVRRSFYGTVGQRRGAGILRRSLQPPGGPFPIARATRSSVG